MLVFFWTDKQVKTQ